MRGKKENGTSTLTTHPDGVPTGNDRPPVIGTGGRETLKVKLRVIKHAAKANLLPHVHR